MKSHFSFSHMNWYLSPDLKFIESLWDLLEETSLLDYTTRSCFLTLIINPWKTSGDFQSWNWYKFSFFFLNLPSLYFVSSSIPLMVTTLGKCFLPNIHIQWWPKWLERLFELSIHQRILKRSVFNIGDNNKCS